MTPQTERIATLLRTLKLLDKRKAAIDKAIAEARYELAKIRDEQDAERGSDKHARRGT